jgi:hypothetical protein
MVSVIETVNEKKVVTASLIDNCRSFVLLDIL